jgi:hypothetical protein
MPMYAWQRSCRKIKLGEPRGSSSWTRGITSLELVPGSQYLFKITVSGPPASEMEQLKPGVPLTSPNYSARKHISRDGGDGSK